MQKYLYPITAILILWIALSFFIPASVYWRDSGEFIITAFFLDIAHPAGFPLYAQLSNLFALIPFGPIAWRVNAFSTCLALFNIVLSFSLSYLILSHVLKVPKKLSKILSIIPALLLLAADSFTKQAYTAEVYLLNAFFIQILILLYLLYIKNDDLRYILASAFIAGLSLGNHAAIACFLLPAAVLVLFDFRKVKNIIIPCFLLGLVGLSIYAYIPARAQSYPPLNSGGAISAERFYNLISNKRRSLVRSQAKTQEGVKAEAPLKSFVNTTQKDLKKLSKELSSFILVIALAGFILLCIKNKKIAFLVFSAAASNWLFFKGWDPDPWTPLMLCVAFCCAISVAWLVLFADKHGNSVAIALIVAFTAYLIYSKDAYFKNLTELKNFELSSVYAKNALKNNDYNAFVILEPSWFIAKYIREIEGYRTDISLVYLPQILYPDYFGPIKLKDSNSQVFDSYNAAPFGKYPNMKSFSALIENVAGKKPVVIEASQTINPFLQNIARLKANGNFEIAKNKPSIYQRKYLGQQAHNIEYLRDSSLSLWKPLYKDSVNYLEATANGAADLLMQLNEANDAAHLLDSACQPLQNSHCSIVSLNNLAVYWMQAEKFFEASQLLSQVIKTKKNVPAVMQRNLDTSLKYLKQEEIDITSATH